MIWLLACSAELQVLSFQDEHNFSFSSSLAAESTPIEAEQDSILDWSTLDTNLLGLPVEEGDIFKLSILLFPLLSESAVLAGISNENLKQSDLSGYVEYFPEPGETAKSLSHFSLQGTPLTPSEHLQADAGTFLLLASTEAEESIMLSLFSTQSGVGNNELSLNNTSAALQYEVDLQSQESLRFYSANRYVIDWQNITQSGSDTPIQGGQIDSFMLAGFTQSRGELEDRFLQLSTLSGRLFETQLDYETALDLSELYDSEGTAFNGFEEFPLWLVGLRCSRCVNPAPLFVGILEP